MEEIKFNSLNELFNRLYPAFNTKVKELKSDGVNISEVELWNYLKNNNWQNNNSLTLYDMVSDIFSVTKEKIINKERINDDNN